MAEDHPADRQHEALSQRKNRTVGRLLQNKERLEELAAGMRRIREPEMPQCIGEQQVAEIVRHAGRWNWILRNQRQPQRNRQNRQQQHAPTHLLRQPLTVRFDERARKDQKQYQQQRDGKLDEVGSAETDWIAQRQERAEQVENKHR